MASPRGEEGRGEPSICFSGQASLFRPSVKVFHRVVPRDSALAGLGTAGREFQQPLDAAAFLKQRVNQPKVDFGHDTADQRQSNLE